MPSKRSMSKLVAHEYPKMQPVQSGALEDITQSRMTIAGGSSAGTFSQWPIDEFLGLNDFHLNYGILDNGSSKVCIWISIIKSHNYPQVLAPKW